MSSDTTRLTFDMPASEHKRLKALAALKGVSLKKLILSCLHEILLSESSLNEETVRSLRETDEGKGLTEHKDVDDMLNRLGIGE
jgi:hypothetical protein